MHRPAVLLGALAWLSSSASLAQDRDSVDLVPLAASGGRALRAAARSLAGARAAIHACGVAPAFGAARWGFEGPAFAIGIDRNGRVESFSIELRATERDASWLACVEAAVRVVRFAHAHASTSVTGVLMLFSPTPSLAVRQSAARRVIRGRVTVEEHDAIGGEGDFDLSIVERAVRTRLRAMRACYEQRLREKPTLSGRVIVDFVISPAGVVSEANVSLNATGDPGLAGCVTDIVRRLRFNPAPEGGSARFKYRFGFERGE